MGPRRGSSPHMYASSAWESHCQAVDSRGHSLMEATGWAEHRRLLDRNKANVRYYLHPPCACCSHHAAFSSAIFMCGQVENMLLNWCCNGNQAAAGPIAKAVPADGTMCVV